jgi:hypothetical protein
MNICEASIYAIGHYLPERNRDDIYDDHPPAQTRR